MHILLYIVLLQPIAAPDTTLLTARTKININKIHAMLGHIGEHALHQTAKKEG